MSVHRYPFAELVRAMGACDESDVFRRLGMEWANTARDRPKYVEVGMPEAIADRLAVRAGLHPYVVWPEMVDHVAADRRRSEARRVARLRCANPEYAERNRAYSRRVWDEHRDAERARRRRRYAANREHELAAERARRARRTAAERGASLPVAVAVLFLVAALIGAALRLDVRLDDLERTVDTHIQNVIGEEEVHP